MNVQKKRRLIFYILNIIIPLVLGLVLYLSFRRDSYIAILVSKYIYLPISPESLIPDGLKAFLRNFVSDILWAYALSFAVVLTIGYSKKRMWFSALICLSFIVTTELFQKIDIFHGTFDVLDILFETLSICLALLFINTYEEAQNEKSRKSS